MATGISYRRVHDGNFSTSAQTATVSGDRSKSQFDHYHKKNAAKDPRLPEIPSQDLPVTCGSFKSVQYSLSSFFKRGKTLNLDLPRETQRNKPLKTTANRQQMKGQKRSSDAKQKDLQKTPISRERSRSASYHVAWRERLADGDRCDVAASTPNARRTDSARDYSTSSKVPETQRPQVHGYIPRNKVIQHMERARWAAIMEPTWEPVGTPIILQQRHPRSKSASRMPNSILKRHLTDEEGATKGADGNSREKHACFKKHVDVYYFQPTDRLATTSTASVGDTVVASDDTAKRSRRATIAAENIGAVDKSDGTVATANRKSNGGVSKASTQPKLEWSTEVTRLPLGDAQDHLNFLRLKVKVNCRYIREKTAVKALSGGRAFVVTIYQHDVDADGTTVVCQHVKKLTVPVTIDPYRVKAHVHKDGLLTVDAPVVPERTNEE